MTIIQFYLSANSVYLVVYILCITPGVFCPPLRGGHSPCPPNKGIPLKLFGFKLKMQQLLIHVSNCATFVSIVCIHVWALIGTLSYYFEGFPH